MRPASAIVDSSSPWNGPPPSLLLLPLCVPLLLSREEWEEDSRCSKLVKKEDSEPVWKFSVDPLYPVGNLEKLGFLVRQKSRWTPGGLSQEGEEVSR